MGKENWNFTEEERAALSEEELKAIDLEIEGDKGGENSDVGTDTDVNADPDPDSDTDPADSVDVPGTEADPEKHPSLPLPLKWGRSQRLSLHRNPNPLSTNGWPPSMPK